MTVVLIVMGICVAGLLYAVVSLWLLVMSISELLNATNDMVDMLCKRHHDPVVREAIASVSEKQEKSDVL